STNLIPMLPYTLILGIIVFIVSALLVRSFAKRGLMLDYDTPNSAEFRYRPGAQCPFVSALKKLLKPGSVPFGAGVSVSFAS
ncbi:MAG: hypothetical protein Q7V05_06235, partial [Methanoregula sp.]|nr:hypothetical protein [Methanoregula sp.]